MSKNLELAKAIRHNLFADRATVKEAWDYAFKSSIASATVRRSLPRRR